MLEGNWSVHFMHPFFYGNTDRTTQKTLWDSLLEMRIKLQKPMSLVNTLPSVGFLPRLAAA